VHTKASRGGFICSTWNFTTVKDFQTTAGQYSVRSTRRSTRRL